MKLIVDGVTFQCHPGMTMTLVPDVDGETIVPIHLRVDGGIILFQGVPLSLLAYNRVLDHVCNLGDYTIKMVKYNTLTAAQVAAIIGPTVKAPPGPEPDEPKKIKWREFL